MNNPYIKSIGHESFHGVIDGYYNPEIYIGNYTSIAPPLYAHGATEHPCIGNPCLVSTYPFGDKWDVNYFKSFSSGPITIGSDVWIGESVTILSGVTIGDGAIIGARSVVAKNVPPFAVVVGNPIRVKRYRFNPYIISKLNTIKWWNWSKDKVIENIVLMKDINKFIDKFS